MTFCLTPKEFIRSVNASPNASFVLSIKAIHIYINICIFFNEPYDIDLNRKISRCCYGNLLLLFVCVFGIN